MKLRQAKPQEAEILWDIRNQAIRHGCKTSYDADVIARRTPGRFIISSVLSRWAKSIITRVWRVLIYAVLKWQSRCNVRNTWLSR